MSCDDGTGDGASDESSEQLTHNTDSNATAPTAVVIDMPVSMPATRWSYKLGGECVGVSIVGIGCRWGGRDLIRMQPERGL